ncbi:MAG: tRNA (adenosine(37)-N6)-threonylcarbamoyltransferase complex transferase subunit TsaD, partial [Bacteroidia bacterium]
EIAKNENFIKENLNDICASYQQAIISFLLSKLKKAAEHYKIKHIAIAGGVSANSELRKQLQQFSEKHQWNYYIPKFEYCTDNAAMIGITAYYKFLNKDFSELDITPKARYKF